MNTKLMKRLLLTSGVWLLLCESGLLSAQGMASIEAILKAHNAWPIPPVSVQITATSFQNDQKVPVKLTATNQEETIIESGESRKVATNAKVFLDTGKTTEFDRASSGFSQLDITSVFLLAQLQQRGVFVGAPEKIESKDSGLYRIHVSTKRSQLHFGASRVNDEFDVYTDNGGILTAISRLYYNDQPYRFNQTWKFLDYRETEKVLLPYRLERYLKGRLIETVIVDKYVFNVETSSAPFLTRRPK